MRSHCKKRVEMEDINQVKQCSALSTDISFCYHVRKGTQLFSDVSEMSKSLPHIKDEQPIGTQYNSKSNQSLIDK